MIETLYNMRTDHDVQPLIELLKTTNTKDLVLCEVGSYRGQSAEIFLNSGYVKKLYCIDPWKVGYDILDEASQTDMELVEKDFDQRVGFNSRVIKLKGIMTDFISVLKDVDLVYLDACHQYESVKADIDVILHQIQPKVAISGHDYQLGWPGVVKAVNETLGTPDKTFADGSWIKML